MCLDVMDESTMSMLSECLDVMDESTMSMSSRICPLRVLIYFIHMARMVTIDLNTSGTNRARVVPYMAYEYDRQSS